MEEVVVITGPTASGKTGISIELSKLIGAEIVNADSMQIFKRCNIGTAKPSLEELSEVKHHLINIVEPDRDFSVAEYKEKAEMVIESIMEKGRRVVITGGTGMYIDALVRNLDFSMDQGATSIRENYNKLLREKGPLELHQMLAARDRKAADSVHPNNTRRVIRYLEILNGYEGSLDEYMVQSRKIPSKFKFRTFLLWPDREFIYKRIEDRIDKMVEDGLIDEVRGLLDSGIAPSMQSMQGIGYKETVSYIKGSLGYDEFIEILKRNTRRYAKRQFTWMNRYDEAIRVRVDRTTDITETAEKIREMLEKP